MAGQVSLWKQLGTVVVIFGAAGLAWQERDRIGTALGIAAEPGEQQASPSAQGVPVLVAPVEVVADDLVLEAVGTGRARRSVTLRVESEGKVAEMPMETGERFEEGEVLLRLEDRQQSLAVEMAETRLAEAERVRARFARLQDAGTAAMARLDEVRTVAELAAIELERTREALEDRVLRAPFDGVAGLADVDIGAWIDSDDEIASFDDRSVILVEFNLPEALLARVSRGMTVTATTPAAPDRRFEGTVESIDSRITAASRTVRVRVAFPNPEDLLRPGASFTVRLELPGERFPVVPELAVQFSRGSLHVWRVDEGTVERVEVRLIRRRDGSVLVDGPLSAGQKVVVEGTQRLVPGTEVNILETSGRTLGEGAT